MHPGVYLPHNRGVLVVATVTGSKASASPELLSQYIHLYLYINIYITLDWGTKVMRTKLALSTELRPASPVDPCLWATSRVCLRRGQHTSYSSLGCVIQEAPWWTILTLLTPTSILFLHHHYLSACSYRPCKNQLQRIDICFWRSTNRDILKHISWEHLEWELFLNSCHRRMPLH